MPETLSPAEALEEMREITHLAALDGGLQRQTAARYTLCRDALLASPLRPSLPGFLIQCLTISRFQDFIHLLDPRPQVRIAFVEEAFRNLSIPSAGARAIDIFADKDIFEDRDF